jgi:hypothetical protein
MKDPFYNMLHIGVGKVWSRINEARIQALFEKVASMQRRFPQSVRQGVTNVLNIYEIRRCPRNAPRRIIQATSSLQGDVVNLLPLRIAARLRRPAHTKDKFYTASAILYHRPLWLQHLAPI